MVQNIISKQKIVCQKWWTCFEHVRSTNRSKAGMSSSSFYTLSTFFLFQYMLCHFFTIIQWTFSSSNEIKRPFRHFIFSDWPTSHRYWTVAYRPLYIKYIFRPFAGIYVIIISSLYQFLNTYILHFYNDYKIMITKKEIVDLRYYYKFF